MLNLGFGETILIVLLILVLFGSKRIPEITGALGKGMREFRRSMNDAQRAILDELPRGAEPASRRDLLSRSSFDAAEFEARRLQDDAERPEPKRLLD